MKFLRFLFSGQLMGLLLLTFAVAIAYATFVENDYDPQTARMVVYNARWFEILILFMVINFSGMIFTKKLYMKHKINILLIHLALVIILIGAAITRYLGQEGMMHIRNGQTSDRFTSVETYFYVQDGETGSVLTDQKILLSEKRTNLLEEHVQSGETQIDLRVVRFRKNVIPQIRETEDGIDHIQLVVALPDGRRDISLPFGEVKQVGNVWFRFGPGDSTRTQVIEIVRDGEEFTYRTGDNPEPKRLAPMALGEVSGIQFLIAQYVPGGVLEYVDNENTAMEGTNIIELQINDEQLLVEEGKVKDYANEDVNLQIYFGTRYIRLPFAIKLNQFILERYPGSNSPSSFKSDVLVIDEPNNVQFPFMIYMNNILSYRGYRFYQSSYDRDELGTVLSVNYDFWGTLVSYIGYALLFGSLIASLLVNNRFKRVLSHIRETHAQREKIMAGLAVIFFLSPYMGTSQEIPNITRNHAREFGKLMVQGPEGRIMPVHTLAGQILIKVHKKSEFQGLNGEQVLLGMTTSPKTWSNQPLIKVNHPEVERLLGSSNGYASYKDFFDAKETYKLSSQLDEVNAKRPAERNALDKEFIKVNERMSIVHEVLRGSLLKLFPLPDVPNNEWFSPMLFPMLAEEIEEVDENLFSSYFVGLQMGLRSGDFSTADEQLKLIAAYQYEMAGDLALPASTIRQEIFYNEINIFKNLFPFYLSLGFVLTVLFFIQILTPSFKYRMAANAMHGLLAVGFVLQTAGLILRWKLSGHAPWSNGYESMIYISWATMLAGFILMKKSPVTLGLTALLAGTTLLTAHMSWMDPQITNLVPVLKSYWLTIHVATITSSYGFLALGALIGFFNLCLMIFRRPENLKRISLTVRELTLILELSLMVGLILLIIGNFLGGIWANESWGRYWGWDPKETWTLVTIIFYSFILHLSLIPGWKSHLSMNFLSLIGFGTVLMTYFGVNYYLSGLHSYAGGDPVPIPSFVYYVLGIIAAVFLMALINEVRLHQQADQSASNVQGATSA